MEKLCVFCEHFDWEGVGYIHYSTLTGGSLEGGASCKKMHFFGENPRDNEEFRGLILLAKKCADYTPPTESRGAAGGA